jgi:hypothetical protein
MERIIKSMEHKYLLPSLELVQEVFSEWDSPEEGKVVRRLLDMQCFHVFILKGSMKMNC